MNQCCGCQTANIREQIMPIIEKNGRDQSMLIQILHESQEVFGYLPLEVQQLIADELRMSLASVYSVVSFYARFTTEPLGEHRISVCLGTACYVKGAQRLLERVEQILGVSSGQTTPDGLFTIDSCRCIGACGLAPVLSVDNDVYGNLKPTMLDDIIAKYTQSEETAS